MRYELCTQPAAATARSRVRADYAARARTEQQRLQRREAAWAALSLAVLVLCWDLSDRLDGRLPTGQVAAPAALAALEPQSKPGAPRRLRKLAEEAEGEAPKSYEWIK